MNIQQSERQVNPPQNKNYLSIGISLLLLPRPGIVGGVETYVRNLLDALNRYDQTNHYYLFCLSTTAFLFRYSNPNIHVITISERNPVDRFRRYMQYHFEMDLGQTLFDRCASGIPLDIMLYPSTIIFPMPKNNVPIVLTVADIQHEYFPEFFSRHELKNRKKHTSSSLAKADRIIAVSAYTKQTLMEKFDLSEEQVDVVHETFNDKFLGEVSAADLARMQKQYKLPAKFLLYPSATWPHKNHRRLLEAMIWMQRNYGFSPPLVLTGMAASDHTKVMSAVRELQLENSVRWLGYVPYEELPGLFKLATVLVFPSLFEGFGIPLVEAMAAGLPVACSRSASLPEVAGDAACYFDPLNTEDIGRTIYSLWNDIRMQDVLRRKGHERIQMFRQERLVDRNIEVFKKTVGGRIAGTASDSESLSVGGRQKRSGAWRMG